MEIENTNGNDELIVSILNAHKEGTSGNIEEGYIIKEKRYSFHKEELFAGKLEIMLPDVFIDIPEDLKILKYPNVNRPQIIKTNIEEGMDFTFHLLEYEPQFRTVKEAAKIVKNVLRSVNPAFVFFNQEDFVVDEVAISWFDFKSYGFDGEIYNLYYYVDLKDKLVQGIFNCKMGEKESWEIVAKDVMQSIKVNIQ